MQLGISVCDLDGNNKIFSLNCLNQLSTVKRIFGWESSFVDIFHQRRRPKNEICYARGLANKQKMKFEGWPFSPWKEGFLSAICCSLWRSHCVFCSVHKRNLHAGAWFARTNDGDGARSKLCIPLLWKAKPASVKCTLPVHTIYIYIYIYVCSQRKKHKYNVTMGTKYYCDDAHC